MYRVGDEFINTSLKNDYYGQRYKVIVDLSNIKRKEGWDYFIQYENEDICFSSEEDISEDINLSKSNIISFKPARITGRE